MANGQGTRWREHNGVIKHLIEVDGETLLQRTARLVNQFDPTAEIIVSSSDERCSLAGFTRHTPLRNQLEIDRFTDELITDDICFLYGDTFYTPFSMQSIVSMQADPIVFVGTRKSIIAVKSKNAGDLRSHINAVREAYLVGELSDCKGWQLFHLYTGAPIGEPLKSERFMLIEDETQDFNTPAEYNDFMTIRKRPL
jgi:hypothetical protein